MNLNHLKSIVLSGVVAFPLQLFAEQQLAEASRSGVESGCALEQCCSSVEENEAEGKGSEAAMFADFAPMPIQRVSDGTLRLDWRTVGLGGALGASAEMPSTDGEDYGFAARRAGPGVVKAFSLSRPGSMPRAYYLNLCIDVGK